MKQALFIAVLLFITSPAGAAQQQTLNDLPMVGRYAVSAVIGNDQPGYHARITGGAVEAENTGHGLTIRFSEAGVELGAGRKSFALCPVMWGYGEELTALLQGVPQAVGNIVTAQRGAVSEWYINGPLGLQQGFTVKDAPQAGSGPLIIDMALDGALAGRVDEDGRGVMLTRADGTALYRYSGLVVRDADGREAKAWLETKDGLVRICVNDAGMNYPLYIDPIIQLAKLTASDGAAGDYFGMSVAISGDTVVVGAVFDDINANSDQGSAYVFVKPPGGWTGGLMESAKLTASDGAANDVFGFSVAISDDTIAVGAPYALALQGAAYVFVKPAGGWATTSSFTARLTASDGAAGDFFGNSVAISGDTVVAGAVFDDINANIDQGSAYVFVKPASGWATTSSFTAKLTASDGDDHDQFGWSVGISGDMVVVGSAQALINANTYQGAAYVFLKPAGGWATTSSYAAKLTASDGDDHDYFGNAVAISGDTVVVGAYGHDIGANTEQGEAYVFVKPSSGWANTTETSKLTASGGAAGDWFGMSVAISNDRVVVGSRKDDVGANTDQGAAYVFVKPSSGWEGSLTEAARLTALDGAVSDGFGMSVALIENTVVVGAFAVDIGANANQGSAYVFKIIADEPATQATKVSFSSVGDSTMTIQWTPGNGSGSIVLMKAGSVVDAAPVDGIDYTANSAFGAGSQIGTGNYVVSNGNGDTVTVTGLSPETTYHVAVYDYSSSPPSEAVNYRQTRPATGSQATSTTLVATADNYTTPKNKTLFVLALGVLANDTGGDNGSMLALLVRETANGSIALNADGSFIYIPDKRFKGTDNFTYRVSDGITESAPATVTITVGKKCPIMKLYGEDSAQVELLRRYRDEVLETTATGRAMVDLYYSMASVVDGLLEHPMLQDKARKIVDGLLPVVEKRFK